MTHIKGKKQDMICYVCVINGYTKYSRLQVYFKFLFAYSDTLRTTPPLLRLRCCLAPSSYLQLIGFALCVMLDLVKAEPYCQHYALPLRLMIRYFLFVCFLQELKGSSPECITVCEQELEVYLQS